MNIMRGRKPGAKKIAIYGVEGIGKSTFASKFPDPVFIDTEDSTKDMDVARFDKPSSWEMLKSQVRYVIDNPGICKTLVIDTADWAEALEIEALCSKNGWDGLEGAGYGKGYTYSAEEFGRLLNLLSEVTMKGVNVVVTAHAQLRKVELPEEMGAYDHWEMKTSKKVAPMIREWADAVLFANYKVVVVNIDKQGAAKGKNKAQGGRRVMYTTHTPFWDAKNRYGLPEELPFDYNEIKHVIEESSMPAEPAKPAAEPVINTDRKQRAIAEKPPVIDMPKETENAELELNPLPDSAADDSAAKVTDSSLDKRIPKDLRDLMLADSIDAWDIENICESKGYVPYGTKIWDYETVNPGLISGGIIGNWSSVVSQIRAMRKQMEVPFK